MSLFQQLREYLIPAAPEPARPRRAFEAMEELPEAILFAQRLKAKRDADAAERRSREQDAAKVIAEIAAILTKHQQTLDGIEIRWSRSVRYPLHQLHLAKRDAWKYLLIGSSQGFLLQSDNGLPSSNYDRIFRPWERYVGLRADEIAQRVLKDVIEDIA
jgi:hypothetical protein